MIDKIFLLIACFAVSTSYAAMSIKDPSDRAIFEEAVVVSSQVLSQNPKDKGGNDLLKFAAWMNSQDARVKTMKAKAVFGDPIAVISASGVSKDSLIRKILERQEALRGESSKRMLYIVIGYQVNPANSKIRGLYEELKAGRFDLTVSKLISGAKKPELADLVLEAQKAAEEEAIIEKENEALSKSYGENEAGEDDIRKVIANTKFKVFDYSESTILDAFNRITHRLYWYGIQVKIKSNRISYTEVRKSTNGAQYYFGPLNPPVKEEFSTKNKTVEQVLDHISTNIGLLWRVSDGTIEIYDDMVPDPDVPEGGIASADMQKLVKGSLKDLLKYRGKVIEMNGLVTGIGRHDHKTDYLSIDGGLTRVYIAKALVNQSVLKRMDTSIEKWRKEGGKQALTKKIREMKESGEEIDYQKVGNANAFIRYRAVVDGVDRGRLVFKDIKYIRIEETGEYLLKNM